MKINGNNDMKVPSKHLSSRSQRIPRLMEALNPYSVHIGAQLRSCFLRSEGSHPLCKQQSSRQHVRKSKLSQHEFNRGSRFWIAYGLAYVLWTQYGFNIWKSIWIQHGLDMDSICFRYGLYGLNGGSVSQI